MVNLKSKLSHLFPGHISNLEIITQRILETGKADVIILFGYFAFVETKRYPSSGYDILVITDHWQTKEELSAELKDAFAGLSNPVHGVIETITMVNLNVEQGLFYFSDILREGIILFDNEEFELAQPKEFSFRKRRKIAEEDYNEWIEKAKGASNSFIEEEKNRNPRMAAFHLNQTVEFCYTTLEMVYSHNLYEEHNVKAQRERIRAFDKRINEAFPLETPEQIKAFQYLSGAYVGAQYMEPEEFPISANHIQYWADECEKLLRLTGVICKDKIQRLKNVEKKFSEVPK